MNGDKFPKLKLKSASRMPAEKVVEIYRLLEDNGINIWIDGGWGVDALLSEQTREHADLDIALNRKDETKFQKLLTEHGFKIIQTNAKTDAQYVMSDGISRIDVHLFAFDKHGNNTGGIKYTKESLTGVGKIDEQTVRCISPEWVVRYHSRYEPADTDHHDIKALCAKFGIPLPEKFKQ